MKLSIKANEKITDALVNKIIRDDEGIHLEKTHVDGEIYMVEITFDRSYLWSDLEFWLEDENGHYCDHAKMNVSKRNKMQFSK